jgi:capsular exopolysaccharide synthesis family protein
VELAYYLKIIRHRRWIIVLTALITTALVAVISSRMPPTYAASTRLRIVPFGITSPDYGAYVYFERLANTYSDILTSDLIVQQAERMLNLEELPDIHIEVIPQTELMRLTVVDTDPARAQTVANTLSQLLVQQNESSFSSDISGVRTELQIQIDEMETQLNDQLEERERLENTVPRDNERIADLDRSINTLQQRYELLLNSFNQAAIQQLSRSNALTIIENAELPTEREGPKVARDTALALVVGLMGGIALAFLVENRAPRFYGLRQIETVLRSSVIGKIPSIKRGHTENVFGGDPTAAEAFRRLRANLFAGSKNQPMRLLLVTSAIPGEGKSTVAANLSAAIAQNGRKVLLVDGNMQAPTLDRRYRLANNLGLSNVLKEETRLEDAVQESMIPNMQLLTAGFANGNSAELLHSEEIADLTARLLHYYDVIVFDMPALLASTDAAVLAPYMNGVLWVIDTDRVDQKVADFAREQLEGVGAEILGVVANRVTKDESFNWVRYYRARSTGNHAKVVPNGKNGKHDANGSGSGNGRKS